MNYPEHVCPKLDEMGDHLPPEVVTCGARDHSWCERCDPAPAALCPICDHGSSTAPIPPRQNARIRGTRKAVR